MGEWQYLTSKSSIDYFWLLKVITIPLSLPNISLRIKKCFNYFSL